MTRAAPSTGPLHHTVLGDAGPVVAFCHGLFGQGRNWTSVARALSGSFRVLLVDLPNHGRSPWTATFSYPDTADLLLGLLEHRFGREPVTLVGHSMGGKVAMVAALRQPAAVARLCVVDIAPVAYPGLTAFADYVRGMRGIDLGGLGDRAAANDQLREAVPDDVVRPFLLQNLRRDSDGWRWQLNLTLLGDELAALGGWPTDVSGSYLGPVLWVAGARSDYVRPEHAVTMRAFFPQTRLVTLKNAGHWVHSEQPEAFLQVVSMFLRPELDRSTGSDRVGA